MVNNQENSPLSFSSQNKDNENSSGDQILEDTISDPEVIQEPINEQSNVNVPIHHNKILNELINQFERIDYQTLAFPNTDDLDEQNRPRLTEKHYLVLSIENIIKVAQKNHWGLCKNLNFIYVFNGAYWSCIDKDEFQNFLAEAALIMGVPNFTAKYFMFSEKLYKQFLSVSFLGASVTNQDKVCINLKNGTFEFNANELRLRPFESADFITYQLPFEYNPDADAPIFQRYLDRVLPDIQRQMVLAEYLGYVFIKNGSSYLKEEKTLILYGTGANGKSVFFEVVNALLGEENVSSYSMQSITNDNGYFRAKLANKLVNYASEISGKLQTAIFKAMVSGEPVEARLPYGEPFLLRQYAKLIFNCNELPRDVEHTNAFFRRFLIIPFDVTIPEVEQDKQLHNKIINNELSGVFNWVLKGLNRLMTQNGFTHCNAVNQATDQYRIQSDTVQLFLESEEYVVSSINYVPIQILYSEYREFCQQEGFSPLNKNNFISRIRGAGIIIEKKNFGVVAFLTSSRSQENKMFFQVSLASPKSPM